MYLPKSQIKTNLHTKGGEFNVSSTNLEYQGFYFKTSTGGYYTGKNPSDLPVKILIPITPILTTETQNPQPPITPTQQLNSIELTYEYLVSPVPKPTTKTLPTQISPTPQDKDYILGEFQRYFLSKTNEPKFIEVNKEQYQRYVDKDKTVSYQLYQPITLPWDISGDRNQVYNTNKRIVEKTQRDNRLRGFKSYFKERYDQFYK